MNLRIALADDQALVRKGLKALLTQPGIAVVIEAANGDELLVALESTAVDVIVSDIRMPGTSGIDALRMLRARGRDTPCILLTTFDDDALFRAAVDAGANGFLLKDVSPEELKLAIERVARGESLLQPVTTTSLSPAITLVERPRPPSSSTDGAPELTERERSVLRLMAAGHSNKEIARSLDLATGTVKNYVSDILDKLQTGDRTRAVLKAIHQRLI
ncbi:MAG: response regulator transcription factor [Rhodanobacteraceae bacterium]|jgi:DNA-binding NarL/FixJ family response regulator|nr:response regulator transcription factor [Rhodanobacteraceae bacterium]MBL0039781.1 response regulator transcription factor [Xanthomonadales bacterium]MBP6078235.1 response regulator transcription factor [Xanthomonadales bacterium]MBP7624138.1 response regulator transcription factor [Xanthomonadales bacterium]